MIRIVQFWNNHRRLSVGLLALAILLLSSLDHAGAFGYRGPDTGRYDGATARVIHAEDGDTIDVDLADGPRPMTRIRLWGVDCPEIAHSPGEQDAYFGRQACEFVRREVVGKRARLALDPNRKARDKYGRLLAYVYVDGAGEMLQESHVRRGLAFADHRFPHVMKHRFGELEKRAIKAKAGLWTGVTPEQMPEWRRRMDAAKSR